jgi:hypothetical protein
VPESPRRPKAAGANFTHSGPREAANVSQAVEVLRQRDRLLDEHRFRSSGNLVVSNLDRIAEIDNVGN